MQETAALKAQSQQENFPVASKWLPARWREPILDFYAFARGLDNIADDPILPREEKRQLLRVIKLGLTERNPEMVPIWAHPYLQLLFEKRLSPKHGEALWQAFWQDTEKSRYRSFAEVLRYCRLSAAPVGRAVLDIAGEAKAERKAADALCIALQLLNHLQDVHEDFTERDRIYLPQQWLEQAGLAEEVLQKQHMGPKLRSVFTKWLDETDKLLTIAKRLPKSVKSWQLRYEIKIIIALACSLSRKLREHDPMERAVKLTKREKKRATRRGLFGIY